MINQQYLQELRKRNGNCACPQQKGLYQAKTQLEGQIRLCKQMIAEADLSNPRASDRAYLLKCKEEEEKKSRLNIDYHLHVRDGLDEGRLAIHMHEGGVEKVIGIEESHTPENKNKLQSIHCIFCNQQIAILTSD